MDLNSLREEIDLVDRELVRQFCQRMNIVQQVLRYKQERNLAIFQPQRERLLIDKVGAMAQPGMELETMQLYTQMMDISKELQHRMLKGTAPAFACGDRATVTVTTPHTASAASWICGLVATCQLQLEGLKVSGETLELTICGNLEHCDILQRLWAVYTPNITIQ